jgi:hypothetical protein
MPTRVERLIAHAVKRESSTHRVEQKPPPPLQRACVLGYHAINNAPKSGTRQPAAAIHSGARWNEIGRLDFKSVRIVQPRNASATRQKHGKPP